jgi:hypothetical protein
MANPENKQYYSILQWITERGIVDEKGEPFNWVDRPWLLDILCDWTPDIVLTACAQVGKTITFMVKGSFGLKHLGFNIINTMPTDDDVREIVAAKVNKFIQNNQHEFDGMDTDSIERKEINGRFWFFKGTVSKTAAISTTADVLIHDEISRSDQNSIQTYKSRTKASKYKGRWIFSNPGVERDELDQAWQKSDQKEWVITCPHCKDEHYLIWPESIDIPNRCYVCRACKKPISDEVRRAGKWVAQNPGSNISGYHISHLMCCWIKPQEIIDDSQGDPAYFNNFVLGKPYSPGDLSITRTTILDLWTPKILDIGDRFIGIDVGNIKHYVIRTTKGLINIGRFSDWSELDQIIATWKPTSGVIDSNPDNFAANHYVNKYPWMRMSTFQENNNNPQTLVWWGEGDKKGVVYSHRDRILDRMFTEMLEAKWLIGLATDKDFHDYIKHYETLRRAKVTNNKGIERYVWESTTGVDHYVFADLYSYLSMLGSGSGTFYAEATQADVPTVLGADNVYDVSRAFSENQQTDE